MAEVGTDSNYVLGSESAFEFYCEFCNENGQHLEASGYCNECGEYLCSKCISNHRGNRLSRHHDILDKKNMPRDTPPSSDRIQRDITTMCQQHTSTKCTPVQYFCKTHDKLTCTRCFVKEHKTCSEFIDIAEIPNTFFNDKEYKDFTEQLNSLETKVHTITNTSRDHVERSKRCCSEAIEAVGQFRDKINSTLDDIVTRLKAEAEDFKKKDIAKLETLEHTCKPLLENITSITSELKRLQADKRVCQAYTKVKETATDVEKIKQKLVEAEDNNTIKTYTFVPNTELREILSRPDVLGLLSIENKVEKKEQSATSVIKAVSSASFVHDINVKSEGDESCYITGSALLSSFKLVLVDNGNYKIKLVDQRSMRIINEMKVAGYPLDVTVIKEDQVAVTVWNNNTILILKVTDTITLVREIKVSDWCHGIVYSKDQLVVTYINPSYIEIMDLYGNVNSKIENDKDGNKLFAHPQYVCTSSDGDTLYVSDHYADKVASLSRDGAVKAIYTDTDLIYPKKVCQDHRGNVYVCGRYSLNIHMLTPDLTKIKVILTQTDGLTTGVFSVSHCSETDRLYVVMNYCDKVKVYQLS